MSKKSEVEVIEFKTFIGQEDADMLRRYADLAEKGELLSYAFIADTKDLAVLFTYASPKRSQIMGLLMRLLHIMNRSWDES